MAHLILVCGLPGCGKTTLAEMLAFNLGPSNHPMIAADDWFMQDGEYKFNPKQLGNAHKWCQDLCRAYLDGSPHLEKAERVIVHNTFSQRWEMESYIRMAQDGGHRLTVINLFDGGLTDEELALRNTHGVPVESIRMMRSRWEHDWKNGNPVPPWER